MTSLAGDDVITARSDVILSLSAAAAVLCALEFPVVILKFQEFLSNTSLPSTTPVQHYSIVIIVSVRLSAEIPLSVEKGNEPKVSYNSRPNSTFFTRKKPRLSAKIKTKEIENNLKTFGHYCASWLDGVTIKTLDYRSLKRRQRYDFRLGF